MVNNNNKKDKVFILLNKIWLILPLFIGLPTTIYTQTVPVFVPNDLDFEVEDASCFCSPGVINKSPGKGLLIEYKLTSGGNFTPDEVPIGVSPSKVNHLARLRMRLKIPLIVKNKTKVLIGFDHFQERYNLNFIQPAFAQQLNLIDAITLKSTRASAYLLQSMGENNYLGIRARVAYNGNFDGLLGKDKFYRQVRFSGIWGIKKREDMEWGLGFFYSNSFTRNIVLPFVLYNRTYNERWGLEAAFPVSILMRYNFNPSSLLLFGPEFSSAAYALKANDNQVEDYYFRHSELNFGAKYEHQLTSWIWANIHGGVQINFDSEFIKTLDRADTFEPDLITGAFLKIGVFLSPPK